MHTECKKFTLCGTKVALILEENDPCMLSHINSPINYLIEIQVHA